MTNTSQEKQSLTSGMAAKWDPSVMRHGYTALPNLLFDYIALLGITPGEQAVLFNLLRYWYRHSEMPNTSKKRIADSIGISTRQVQRNLRKLEAKKIIEIISSPDGVRSTNRYSFDGLKKKLIAIGKAHRKEEKLENWDRHNRVVTKLLGKGL